MRVKNKLSVTSIVYNIINNFYIFFLPLTIIKMIKIRYHFIQIVLKYFTVYQNQSHDTLI